MQLTLHHVSQIDGEKKTISFFTKTKKKLVTLP